MTDPAPADDIGYLLTAYADGALHPEGAAWVEEQLARSPALRARLAEIRRVQIRLRGEPAPAAPAGLDVRRMDAVIGAAAMAAARPPRTRRLRPWMLATVGVALVAMLVLQQPMLLESRAHRLNEDAPPVRVTRIDDSSARRAWVDNEGGGVYSPTEPKPAPANGLIAGHEQLIKSVTEGGVGYDDVDESKKVVAPGDGAMYRFASRNGGGAVAGKPGWKGPGQADLPVPTAAPAAVAALDAARPATPPPSQERAEVVADSLILAMRDGKDVQHKSLPEPGKSLEEPQKSPGDLRKEQIEDRQEPSETAYPVWRTKTRTLPAKPEFGGEQLAKKDDTNGRAKAPMRPMPVQDGKERQAEMKKMKQQAAQDREDDDADQPMMRDELAARPDSGRVVRSQGDVEALDTEGDAPTDALQRQVVAKLSKRLEVADETTAADFWREGRPPAKAEDREKNARLAGANAEEVAQDQKVKPIVGNRNGLFTRDLAKDFVGLVMTGTPDSPGRLRAGPDVPAQSFPLSAGGTLAQAFAAIQESFALSVDPAVADHLARPAPAPAPDETIAHWLVRAARAAGLQLRPEAGGFVIAAPRPLDPTATAGLDRAAFRAAFGSQPMIPTSEDAQATFSLDAGTASYDRAKALLLAGQPVDPMAIQVEQFVNAMPADYPTATGPEAFTLLAEAGPSPFAAGEVAGRTELVAVGVISKPADSDERRPLRLTLAIDCSASMAQPGGLARVRVALGGLIDRLRADDRIAVVAFRDRAEVAAPATPGDQRDRLRSVLAGLTPEGGTNAAEGLALAYQLAAEDDEAGCEHRVLLVTDGATLVGTAADEAAARIEAFRHRGVGLTVVECGDHAGAGKALDKLVERGGQHLVAADDAAARELFTTKLLPERLETLARDAKAQVRWNPDRVAAARLIGFEERRLKHEDFRDDSVAAGELARDTRMTALFEIVTVDGGTGPLGTAAVRYFDTRRGEVRELACPLPGTLLAAHSSPRLQLFACAAELGELLQQGWWSNARGDGFERLIAELRCIHHPAAAELLRLAERAAALQNGNHP